MDQEQSKSRMLSILTRHIGKQNAISMAALHVELFGVVVLDKINDTRATRELIEELQWSGQSIMSCQRGYYFPSSNSEWDDYSSRITRRHVRALAKLAKQKKISAPAFFGQLRLDLINKTIDLGAGK